MVFVRKRTRNSKEKHSESSPNETVIKRLFNAEEAAQYLGLKIITVYKKSRMRELPSVKLGRALRFDVKALDRYIEQNTITVIDLFLPGQRSTSGGGRHLSAAAQSR